MTRRALSLFITLLGAVFFAVSGSAEAPSAAKPHAGPSILSQSVESIDGDPVALEQFRGKVILIVNTASRCGFTSQFKGLEEVYQRYRDKGFVVLGFSSNDFLGQDPGTNGEIKQFCKLKYGVDFPMFARNPVTGKDIQAVYRILTEQSGEKFNGPIGWNFEKFLVGRDGTVRARFSSFTTPSSERMSSEIEKLLSEPAITAG